MNPDELRAAAERHYHCQSSERDVDVLIEAARRLADVIEYAEMREWASANGVLHIGSIRVYQTPEETVAYVGRLARGETNERGKP